MNPGAGGTAAGTALSQQILSTLKDMNAKLTKENNQTSTTNIFGASAAANIATGGVSRALNAAPNVSGTLGGNIELLLGSIGGDQRMVEQVVGLSKRINDLRNSWQGLSQETRSFVVNSFVATTALYSLSHAASFGTNVLSGVGRTAGAALPGVSRLASGAISSGSSSFMGGVRGVTRTPGPFRDFFINENRAVGMGRGLGVMGAGAAVNAAFGENLVGDAMMMGGALETGLHINRAISSRRFMQSYSPAARATGRMVGRGTIGALVAMAYPHGSPSTESHEQTMARTGDNRVADVQQSLSASNEDPWGFGGVSRTFAALGRGEYNAQWKAAQDAGILSKNSGGILGNLHYYTLGQLGDLYHGNRPWTQDEMQAVAQNTVRPGSVSADPKQRQLNQLTGMLNFQSRQLDVGDLHSFVQGDAVRPEMDQQLFKNLTESIERLTSEIAKQNGNGTTTTPPT